MSEILLPKLFSMIVMVLSLTFKSLIHFEFILVCGVRMWSSFIFLQVSDKKITMAQIKEQIKAPEKTQLSNEEIANLSGTHFKTLVIRMLTEMV